MPPRPRVQVKVRWRTDCGREAEWRRLATLLLAKAMPPHERGRGTVEPGDEPQGEPLDQISFYT